MLVKRQREAKMGGKPQRQASRIGCTDYICHIWERVNTGGGEQGSGDRKRGNGPEESAESLSMRSSSINWLSQHKKILDCGLLSHNAAQTISRQDTTRIRMSADCNKAPPHTGKKTRMKQNGHGFHLLHTDTPGITSSKTTHPTQHRPLWHVKRETSVGFSVLFWSLWK